MLTGKQRAKLRAAANGLSAETQVGREGVSPALLRQVGQALEARELIKLRVLENSGVNAKEACGQICGGLGAEPVQVIGGALVVFKKKSKESAFDDIFK